MHPGSKYEKFTFSSSPVSRPLQIVTSEDEDDDPDGDLHKIKKKKLKKEATSIPVDPLALSPPVKSDQPVKCKECGKNFKKQSNLQLHIEKVGYFACETITVRVSSRVEYVSFLLCLRIF